MTNKTLLDLTQDILNIIESDPVDSIGDTIESDQIAKIIRKTYYDIVEEYGLSSNRELVNLEGQSSITRPNLLRLPQNVQSLIKWKYNNKDVTMLKQEDFLDLVQSRDASDTTNFMQVSYSNSFVLTIDIRKDPTYWTSFDDKYIVTDSFNQQEDTTLQASKAIAWVEWQPHFELNDNFVPVLPDNLTQLLYRTAEGEVYSVYKQTVNPKLEQKERRLRIRAQRNKHRTSQEENNLLYRSPNYGRS